MKISGIYKIQSRIKPERIYIGSSINIYKRWGDHNTDLLKNRHGNSRLQNHYNKYGESDLQFSVLCGCEVSEIIKNEQFFIEGYNPYFNICKIAGNTLGKMHSEESKRKMSESKKGHKVSDETKAKMSVARKGSKRSEETKLKMSVKAMGNKNAKGTIQSEEIRKKHAEGKTGNTWGFKKGNTIRVEWLKKVS